MGYSYLVYGISNLMNDTLGLDSIYLCGILLCGMEVGVYSLVFVFRQKLSRRSIHIISYFGIALLSLFLLCLSLFQKWKSANHEPIDDDMTFEILETGFVLSIEICLGKVV